MGIFLSPEELEIPSDRQRDVTPDVESHIQELAEDIDKNDLYHAPAVTRTDRGFRLVAGWCRTQAILALLESGRAIRYGTEQVEGKIPVHVLDGERTEADLQEIELHENLKRRNLSWVEKARAIAKLQALRESTSPGWTKTDTARELADDPESKENWREVSESIILAPYLNDPEIAQAETRRKALKKLESKLAGSIYRARAETEVPADSETSDLFRDSSSGEEESKPSPATPKRKALPIAVLHMDAGSAVSHIAAKSYEFECIIADPPYGIDVGKSFWGRGGLSYPDSLEAARKEVAVLASTYETIAAKQCHIYMFCAPQLFHLWAPIFEEMGWQVWPRPIIWDRSPKGLAGAWEWAPRMMYETVLYARKGEKPAIRESRPDIIRCPLEPRYARPGEKPESLYTELLSRSCHPGDKVLDLYAGTGPLIDAAAELNLSAVCVDQDPIAIGIMQERLEEANAKARG